MLSSSLGTTRILKEVTLGKIRVVLHDSGLKTSPFLHLEAVLNVFKNPPTFCYRGVGNDLVLHSSTSVGETEVC